MKKLLLAFLLAFLAGPAFSTTPGRVWHVSVALLPSVPVSEQFRSIGEATKVVAAGDTVLIHSGVYRESVTVSASGTLTRPICFEAAPLANVVVTGADVLTGWRKEPGPDNIYSVAWPYDFLDYSPAHAHPDDDYHLLIGRVEQVLVHNYLLHQVLQREQMSRGSFFADQEAKRLFVWSTGNEDLNGIPSEASIRGALWQCTGDFVHTRGLCFRYAANAAQQGAANFTGRSDVIQGCIFERTSGQGAEFHGSDQVVQSCKFRDNGELGFSASDTQGLRVTDCLLQNNNTKGFNRSWEAGGSKVCRVRGMVVDHCRILNNRGSGLWFDIGCETCEINNCLIADNEDAGIFFEISYGLYAHDNVIVGNGLAESPGEWGAQAGICLSSSPGCTIKRNILSGNREGFDFREQQRTTPRIGSPPGSKQVRIWNHDEVFRQNALVGNRDAQVWGWFAVWDERQWPKAMQIYHQHERPDYISPPNFARQYQADLDNGAPTGLSLETLHLVFANNLYDAPDGQGLFHWGTAWWRHQYYGDLDSVRHDLYLEQGSRVSLLRFADPISHDFRVPANSPLLQMDCYPHGTVPEVRLGVFQAQK